MKDHILFISSATLLFVSSSIFSQPDSAQHEIQAGSVMMVANLNPDIATDMAADIVTDITPGVETDITPLPVTAVDRTENTLPATTTSTANTTASISNDLTTDAGKTGEIEPALDLSQDSDLSADAITSSQEKVDAPAPASDTLPSDEEIARLRQLFLTAENHLKRGEDAEYFLLIDKLKDYPLYPYLQYQWLKKNLDRERQVKHFLESHKDSRYAPNLRRKWLHHLGKQHQWRVFLANYTPGKSTILNCYYRQAQTETGATEKGLRGAGELWAVGHSQPDECDPLFKQLKASEYFTAELKWKRFDAALRNNKTGLAVYVKGHMSDKDQATADLWLKLHKDPARYLQAFLQHPLSTQSPLMFSHAVQRLAQSDIKAAIDTWDANRSHYAVAQDKADRLEKKLAMQLVFEGDDRAYDRLSQLGSPDKSSKEWRIRAALAEQNWDNVLSAIHALSTEEKDSDKWQYWLARAYMETGQIAMAQALLSDLSSRRSFYGYLAADRVDSLYQLSENPVVVSDEEIDELRHRDAFRVAFEFMIMARNNDAKLQWWHAVRNLNKREIVIAAKLAQRWQWHEIAIFTIAKARYWDDMDIRFPFSYVDNIYQNSIQNNLNPAIVMGLVRRESAFNEKAYSPVGARGLMQIMPSTGRLIARNLNERWRGSNSLYNPELNIKYGAYYYQYLLQQFDGNYAIALAAYNAGPGKVRQWLPETRSVPADIWIETIPYKETREYVSNVLAYALIYQQRSSSKGHALDELTMNELTQDILPLESESATEL